MKKGVNKRFLTILIFSFILLSFGFVRAEDTGGNWQYVLDLLNQKRTDVDKSSVSVSHQEDIDMDGVLTIQQGTVDILEDYGFTGLADALHCAGYAQSTWAEGFDCKNEIRDILNLMTIITSGLNVGGVRRHINYFKLWYECIPGKTCDLDVHEAYDPSRECSGLTIECPTCSYGSWSNGGRHFEKGLHPPGPWYYAMKHIVGSTSSTLHIQAIEEARPGFKAGKLISTTFSDFGILHSRTYNLLSCPKDDEYWTYGCTDYEGTGEEVELGTWIELDWIKTHVPNDIIKTGGDIYFELPSNTYCLLFPHSRGLTMSSRIAGHTCNEKVPRASFTYSPENPAAGEEITFDASSSYDPDGEIVSYNWDFGDGNSAEGKAVTHAHTEAGQYTVTLTVTDNEGLTNSTSRIIEVDGEISGIVYKDEDGNLAWNEDEDFPIEGAVVIATLDGEEIKRSDETEADGQYSIKLPPGSGYVLEVFLPAKVECYDPEKDAWGDNHSTIEGMLEDVSCPSEVKNISVEYRPLNYVPEDYSWELWHYGPTFDKNNVVLVHGFQFPARFSNDECDDAFIELDDLLQHKREQYNVWQFEYAGEFWGTPDSLTVYADRLGEAIDRISQITGRSTCSIIAHSMGGAVARSYIERGGKPKIDKLLTLATPHMGIVQFVSTLELVYPFAAVARELRPDSRFLWDLNTKVDASTAPETATIGGYHCGHTDCAVEIASTSLVECNPDGSVAKKLYFAGVDRTHSDINDIDEAFDELFLLIRGFLREGQEGIGTLRPDEEPGDYGGNPFLTFALKEYLPYRVRGLYPRVVVTNTGHEYLGLEVYSQGDKTEDTEDGSYIFTVQLKPDDEGEARIYYAEDKYKTVQIHRGQATLVTEAINNSGYGEVPPENVVLSTTPISAENGGFPMAGVSGTYTEHSIFIPSGAISQDTVIYISEPSDNHGLSSAVEFTPEGTIFYQDATITVEYKDTDVPDGYYEENMRLLVWEDSRWNEVPGSVVDAEANTVSGQVSHLSVFAAGIPGFIPIVPGDINGDGQVNVLDVQACVNVILGRETDPEVIQRAKAVAEPYDECNVLDAQTIVNIILGGLEPIPGDLDGDSDVDRDDLNIILSYRNQPATEHPRCDLDGDGMITALDARKLVLLCTRPRCACE